MRGAQDAVRGLVHSSVQLSLTPATYTGGQETLQENWLGGPDGDESDMSIVYY